jgi:hypothetical protein
MRWLVVMVVLFMARAATAATAPDPSAPPVLPPARPNEGGLGAAQVLLGTGVVVLSEAAMLAGNAQEHADLAVPIVLIGPLIGGFVVCGVGASSKAYEGRCAPAVGGAYVGALLAVPAAFLGCYLNKGSSSGGDNGSPCAAGALVGGSIAYVIGTGVGATVGWHAGKRPRRERARALAALAPPPALTAAPANDAWPELRSRPAASAPQGTPLMLSLLSLRF